MRHLVKTIAAVSLSAVSMSAFSVSSIAFQGSATGVKSYSPSAWNTVADLVPARGSYVLEIGSKLCSKYVILRVREDKNSVGLENREIYFNPADSSEQIDGFRHVNGNPYDSHFYWNVGGPHFQTTLKNGRLVSNGVPASGEYGQSIVFSHDLKNDQMVLEYQNVNDNKSCVYRKPKEGFEQYAQNAIDVAIQQTTSVQFRLLRLGASELRSFCNKLRNDRYFSQDDETGRNLCLNGGTQTTVQIAQIFTKALAGLGRERLGIQNPLAAYGETKAADRLYRVSDDRAVFSGYDPLGIFQRTLANYVREERCEQQNYDKETCHAMGVLYAAAMINSRMVNEPSVVVGP